MRDNNEIIETKNKIHELIDSVDSIDILLNLERITSSYILFIYSSLKQKTEED